MYVHTCRYRCMLKSTSMIERSWQHVLKLLRLIYKACLCLGSAPLLTRSPAAVSSGVSSAGSRDSASHYDTSSANQCYPHGGADVMM